MVVDAPDAAEAAMRDMGRERKAQHTDWTGVYCVHDLAAIRLIHALEAEGFRVPQDISVVGFDDLPAASMMSPRLSTVRVDCQAIGAQAIALMQRLKPDFTTVYLTGFDHEQHEAGPDSPAARAVLVRMAGLVGDDAAAMTVREARRLLVWWILPLVGLFVAGAILPMDAPRFVGLAWVGTMSVAWLPWRMARAARSAGRGRALGPTLVQALIGIACLVAAVLAGGALVAEPA
jgi:hypothetical protein